MKYPGDLCGRGLAGATQLLELVICNDTLSFYARAGGRHVGTGACLPFRNDEIFLLITGCPKEDLTPASEIAA